MKTSVEEKQKKGKKVVKRRNCSAYVEEQIVDSDEIYKDVERNIV